MNESREEKRRLGSLRINPNPMVKNMEDLLIINVYVISLIVLIGTSEKKGEFQWNTLGLLCFFFLTANSFLIVMLT